MNPRLVGLAAVCLIATGDLVRGAARDVAERTEIDEPWAPSPQAAPVVSLGYREVGADLLFLRLIGYFGGRKNTPEGVTSLVEAIVAMDPYYAKTYTWGASAILFSAQKVRGNEYTWRAIHVLEQGIDRFPDDYKIPQHAGELYLVELATKDPAERRSWDERGIRLLELAVRRPGAPASVAVNAIAMRTRLGQRQRAIDNLKEMILVTDDVQTRNTLLAKLGELEAADADEIAGELLLARKQFVDTWQRERPAVPPSLYLLIGPQITPGFDPGSLATGGRDLLGTEPMIERLPPVE